MIFPPFYNSEYPIQSYFVFIVYVIKLNMRIGLTQLGTRCSDCPREPSKQLIVLESPVKAEAEFI